MGLFGKNVRMWRKPMLVGVVAGTIISAVGAFGFSAGAANVTFNAPKDCDNNAVIHCGAMSASALVTAYDANASAQKIYSYFGITKTAVHAMPTTAVAGKVMKNGDVVVNGKVVATNALTAGRQNIAGSRQVTSGGVTFYAREPKVSFNQNALDAYVVMTNGKFSFAVIASCGNPVKATPKVTPKPNYAITKEVQTKGGSSWQKSVTVKPGTHVLYRITVTSTGDAPLQTFNIRDKLPANVTYVPGTLMQDGSKQGMNDSFFAGGFNLPSVPAGARGVYTFEAIVGAKDTAEKCTAETLKNTALMSSKGLPNKEDSANVVKQCSAKPVYACTSLDTPLALSRTNYQFTVKGNAQNGATITGYKLEFGDGQNKTITTSAGSVTTEHAYDQVRSHTIVASVMVKVDNTIKTVTADTCKKTITIKPAPVAECTGLVLQKGDNRSVTATASFSPSTATLKMASFDFGDNTAPLVTDKATAQHTYAAEGDYTVKATLTFTIENKDVTSECQQSISFTPPTTTPTPVTPVSTTPEALPSTGVSDMLGLFAAVAVAGAVAHRLVWARYIGR